MAKPDHFDLQIVNPDIKRCPMSFILNISLFIDQDLNKGIEIFAICCAGGVFCLQRISRHSCKMVIYLGGVFFLLPDYLAMPVALDRINAVRLPMWYKEWCSQRNAWVVIGPICAFLLALAVPKSAGRCTIAVSPLLCFYPPYSQSNINSIFVTSKNAIFSSYR